MIDFIKITCYFFTLFFGLLFGLYVGLSIRSYSIEKAANAKHKALVKNYRKKRKLAIKEQKKKEKELALIEKQEMKKEKQELKKINREQLKLEKSQLKKIKTSKKTELKSEKTKPESKKLFQKMKKAKSENMKKAKLENKMSLLNFNLFFNKVKSSFSKLFYHVLPKKEKTNLISERIPDYESYAEFICEADGIEDSSEYIQKAQKSQDKKYAVHHKKSITHD